MRKSKFCPTQIVGILKEYESGKTISVDFDDLQDFLSYSRYRELTSKFKV